MNYRQVGKTDVRLTEFGLGTAPIGNLYAEVSNDAAEATVAAAWAGGIRYFDTAPHYGLGLAERRLGRALAGRRRSEFCVSTKVGRLLIPNPEPRGSDLAIGGFAVPDDLTRIHDYSREGVLRSLDASLDRMNLDRVDVVYVHDPEQHMDQALREALPTLEDLRQQGVIGAIGVGMNYWQPLLRFAIESAIDLVMVAGRWTLADRSAMPLLDECAQNGVSVVAAAPFNSGLLAQHWPGDDARFDYGQAPIEMISRARGLARMCEAAGACLPHAALQFPLRHPAVVAVMVGARDAGEATQIASWADSDLPDSLWRDLG